MIVVDRRWLKGIGNYKWKQPLKVPDPPKIVTTQLDTSKQVDYECVTFVVIWICVFLWGLWFVILY